MSLRVYRVQWITYVICITVGYHLGYLMFVWWRNDSASSCRHAQLNIQSSSVSGVSGRTYPMDYESGIRPLDDRDRAGRNTPLTKPRHDTDLWSNRQLLLVGVMTCQKHIQTRATAIQRTWAQTINGKVVFFTSVNSTIPPGLPVVRLPSVDDSLYPPRAKSVMMLKYMHDAYIDKFEWFMRAEGDLYVNSKNIETFLRSVDSSMPQYIAYNRHICRSNEAASMK
jgi:hypothetical protein